MESAKGKKRQTNKIDLYKWKVQRTIIDRILDIIQNFESEASFSLSEQLLCRNFGFALQVIHSCDFGLHYQVDSVQKKYYTLYRASDPKVLILSESTFSS